MSFTLWFTGLSGAGKSSISARVYEEMIKCNFAVELLDGDIIRTNFAQDLTFSKEHRDINVKRIGFISKLLNKHGVISIVAMISPYAEVREQNRQTIGNYIEVFVECPLDVLKKRDTKGLYGKAEKGLIKNFTGISDPYELPTQPEVVVRTDHESLEESVAIVMDYLKENNYI
ncbi:adenylyl-sulfate kinase [Desulfovibrio gilichinskyi]|uniref:Adenylyl-sulfate kinase n=1 Tax=Desulfovibrio gilichinskyi TaxID=1519643 RepID=A0A1X7C631_9BACT|nr:adenylyl-sulfate kinase [Desulfovibrio gilichinskyi]SME90650.1 adenylylsulfate kinase [Desulfovibrio gilichinskyi]